MRSVNQIVLVLTVCSIASAACAGGDDARLYLSSFQAARVAVFDLDSGSMIQSIPVEDGAGIAGIAVSADGRSLFVVDRDLDSRLRVFDTTDWELRQEHSFEDRALVFGGRDVAHLSGDSGLLFLETYSYQKAAGGALVFDAASGSFLAMGPSGGPCQRPVLASGRTGVTAAVCPERAQLLGGPKGVGQAPEPGASVLLPFETVGAAALASDGGRLYAIGTAAKSKESLLVQWKTAGQAVSRRDLSELLGSDAADEAGAYWLDTSPDGRFLGLAHGSHLWVLQSSTLEVQRHEILPAKAQGGSFSPGGDSFVTMNALEGGGAEVVRLSIETGKLLRTPLSGAAVNGPILFAIALPPQ